MLWFSYQSYCQRHKHVSIVLDSKWPDTPLHLETSEFLNEENPELFWQFIDSCQKLDTEFVQKYSPRERYEKIMNITNGFLSVAKVALLKYSLALRAYSPAVEMFHQIAYDQKLPDECETVVEVNGEFLCDIAQLDSIVDSDSISNSRTYKFDHVYPTTCSASITAILYGEIGIPSFSEFHNVLKAKADRCEISYIVRHYVWKRNKRKVRLSGYGVELAIKSTEYKSQDDTKVKDEVTLEQEESEQSEELEGFIFSRLKDLHPDKKSNLNELKAHILENTKEIPTLKVWELQELSLQAAQKIVNSPNEEALRIMKDIVQNFPTQARSLIHVSVSDGLRKEVDRNQQMFMHHHNLGPADSALFVNGMYFDVDATDVFSLLQVLKQEMRVLEGLHVAGVTEKKATKLLKMDFSQEKQDYALDIRDSAIQYVNDLEADHQYRNWPSSVQDLLRPTYPGMLRSIRKNIYHMVIVADPSKDNCKDIFRLAESFYVHKAPVRIGLAFAVNSEETVDGFSDAGVAMLEAFNFIRQVKTPYDGLSFITDVYASTDEGDVPVDHVISQFKSRYVGEDLDLVFGKDSDYDSGRKLTWNFVNRTGIGNPPQVLLNGVLLKQNQLTADLFEEAVLTEIMKQTPPLQKSVYKGELTDSHNILDYLMEQKNVMPRLNQRILSPDSVYVDLTGQSTSAVKSDIDGLSKEQLVSAVSSTLKYLTKREDQVLRPLTLWIVGDYGKPSGRSLLTAALTHMKSSNQLRLGIIHNNGDHPTEGDVIIHAIQVALNTLDRHLSKLFITKLVKEGNAKSVISGEKGVIEFSVSNMDSDAFLNSLIHFDSAFMHLHRVFCQKILKIAPGERAVLLNGRVIGPLSSDELFTDNDFQLLEKYSISSFGEKMASELNEDVENKEICSDMIMKVSSILLAQTQTRARYEVKFYGDQHSVVKIPAADETEPAHELIAVTDPISKGAQKLAPLLMVLQRVINAHITVFFNCVEKHSAMPLQSFSRYVLEAEPSFATDGSISYTAKFMGLPTSPLLTLAMVTPENWLVEVVRSPHDLDNIHLEQVETGIYAEFELEHLLLEGHCFEHSTGNPPRGLQFTLGTNSTPVIVDTIVMANLGYFQLKANPGAWLLRLRQGRSTDIYYVSGHENTDSSPDSPDVVITVSSFRSHIIKVKVNKKPGKQYEELLYDGSESSSIWNTITSTFSSDKSDADEDDHKINIFSLASGHLYERLLRIMMLSVLKHTSTPVKFWFLKNYLSPTFKDFLPIMAEKYGFEYELVQYKWPRWLNQQSEKQRIIWGYKILFLDVLFPLDVKKIIFVDADQVVRADMKELRDLDLGGAPYGYTPFCDSRKDMDGYRFWKSGYWASHLAGRKYHISALYVVDLKKFRRIAAGDRLRGQYQGLSQDPNSLSNLDQDLPNNMIHQVNIKSLPQEWLWCETWCDDESKQHAKTIDLCNNPKTKEPKLVSALRIIAEWKDYDSELKQLFEEHKEQKKDDIQESSSKPTGIHEEL